MSLLSALAKKRPVFLMTIYDLLYYYARVTRFFFLFYLFFLLQMKWGLHVGFPACFKHFSQEYSDSCVLVPRLIHSFIVSAGTSSSVSTFLMFIIIVY